MRGRYLTPEQRSLIITLRRSGCTREDLAARFGVKPEAITRVVVQENRRSTSSAVDNSAPCLVGSTCLA